MAIHKNISRADYEALPGINWSVLKAGHERLGAHILAKLSAESVDKPAFKFGRAFHQKVLQPDIYSQSWEFVTGKTTTKPGCLTESDHGKICHMAEAFEALGATVSMQETALTWTYGGVACKGMIDGLFDGYLGDLKSCQDASPQAFAPECYRYLYHGQCAWYCEGLRKNDIAIKGARIIAIEKEPPYASADYILADRWLEMGTELIDALLEAYISSMADDTPPSYGQRRLEVPEWADRGTLDLLIDGESVEV